MAEYMHEVGGAAGAGDDPICITCGCICSCSCNCNCACGTRDTSADAVHASVFALASGNTSNTGTAGISLGTVTITR